MSISFIQYIIDRTLLINPRLLAIGGLAFLLAAVWSIGSTYIDPITARNPLHGDASRYHEVGLNIAAGRGISTAAGPTSFQAPGYSILLAGIYAVAGPQLIIVKLVQAGLHSFTVILVYIIARLILIEDRWALLAAILIGLNPLLVYTVAWIYPETFFVSIIGSIMVLVALICRYPQFRSSGFLFLLGVAEGIATIVKSSFLPMLPVSVVWAYFVLNRGQKYRGIIAVLVGISLTTTPWMIRNYLVHGQIILVSTNTGSNLYGGNQANSLGGFAPGSPYILPGESEVSSDRLLINTAMGEIMENKAEFLKRIPQKAYKLFALTEFGTSGKIDGIIPNIINGLYFMYLIICTIGGSILLRKSPIFYSYCLLILLVTLLTTVVFFGATRFQIPLAPIFTISAVEAIRRGAMQWSNRGGRRSCPVYSNREASS
jgi:hypothetical protein